MRPCNNYQPTGIANIGAASRIDTWVEESRSQPAKSHHVLFFFMCRSTCSHCWKKAMKLAKFNKLFEASNTTVLLVGDGRYRKQAQRFSEELDIPFRYISDNGALRRYYNVETVNGRGCRWAMVFVDDQGIIRFSKCGLQANRRSSRAIKDLSMFLKSIKNSCCRETEHIMRRPVAAAAGEC